MPPPPGTAKISCTRAKPVVATVAPHLIGAEWLAGAPLSCLPEWTDVAPTVEHYVAETTRRFVTQEPPVVYSRDDRNHIRVVLVMSSIKTPEALADWRAVYGVLKRGPSTEKQTVHDYKGALVPYVLNGPERTSFSEWIEANGRGDRCNRDNIVWVGALLNEDQEVAFRQIGVFLPLKLRSFCNLLHLLLAEPHWHTRLTPAGLLVCDEKK